MRSYKYDPYRNTFTRIDEAPTIDAVEVTRCKDCMFFVNTHLKKDFTEDNRYKADYCEYHREHMKEDDFCSKGERI